MIIDTGGLLIVLLVLTIPAATWLIQRGKRNRTNALLAQIAERQRLLGPTDEVQAVNSAATGTELDAAVSRLHLQRQITDLISLLPPDLRDEFRRGA